LPLRPSSLTPAVTRVQAQNEAAGRIIRLSHFIAEADFFYKFFIC